MTKQHKEKEVIKETQITTTHEEQQSIIEKAFLAGRDLHNRMQGNDSLAAREYGKNVVDELTQEKNNLC